MSDLIYLTNVRLSFPAIATPKAFEEGGKAMYGADFILPPDHPGFAAFMKAVNERAVLKWTDKAAAILQMIHGDRKLRCYSRGEERIDKKTMEPLEGYAGMVCITAKKDRQPQLIGLDGLAVDPENTMQTQAIARKLYGGCYVNVAVKPWLQDNKYGKGVRCDFVAIQFAKDGPPFGEGVTDASGMFGAVVAPTAESAPAPWGAPAPFQQPTPGFFQ